jgi:branched-chain amino acid transport system permease protein
LLAVDALAAFYGDFQALFGITLRVDEGETVAVIGANGAGKTTFLKAIAGLLAVPAAAVSTTFVPSSGPDRLLFAFEAVIIGGLGSLWGTLAGGVILGVAQTIGAKLSPGWGVLTGHLVFLAVLLVRPTGLFKVPR